MVLPLAPVSKPAVAWTTGLGEALELGLNDAEAEDDGLTELEGLSDALGLSEADGETEADAEETAALISAAMA